MKAHLGWLALGLASLSVVACGGPPDEGASEGALEVTAEDKLGLLVTPGELAALGATHEEIAAQARLFDQLTPQELEVQAALRSSQETRAEELSRLPDVGTEEAAAPPANGGVSSQIWSPPCWTNSNYYQVYWSGGNVSCYADAGTLDVNLASAINVRPGNNVGRTYYTYKSAFYWSPWRGKSMTIYKFDHAVRVLKVQIK